MPRNWTRDEVLAAFNLYCKTPFGRLHRSNAEIIALAAALERTPSSIAMKLVNLASLDPVQQRRNIRGLQNASNLDKLVWQEFVSNPTAIAIEAATAWLRLQLRGTSESVTGAEEHEPDWEGPTFREGVARIRLAQRFFRTAVLASYNFECTVCGLDVVELLNASHIIPWSVDERRQADPRNGLSMCALHDRVFDRGLMTVDTRHRIVVSSSLLKERPIVLWSPAFTYWHDQSIRLPQRFEPDHEALEYHRNNIFRP